MNTRLALITASVIPINIFIAGVTGALITGDWIADIPTARPNKKPLFCVEEMHKAFASNLYKL